MENIVEVRHYVTPSGKDAFDSWLTRLADSRTQAKIATRINRVTAGNFGDCKPVRGGVYELRIDWGPGLQSLLRTSWTRPGIASMRWPQAETAFRY